MLRSDEITVPSEPVKPRGIIMEQGGSLSVSRRNSKKLVDREV